MYIYYFSDNSEMYWFIYLTNWAFFCLAISVLVHAAITVTEYTTFKLQGIFYCELAELLHGLRKSTSRTSFMIRLFVPSNDD